MDVEDTRHIGIDAMTQQVREVAAEKGWRDVRKSLLEDMMMVVTECTETVEAFRDYGMDGPLYDDQDQAKPVHVGSEMADVLIRLLMAADVNGVDLATEFERKMAYVRAAPAPQGGKRL